MHSNDLFKAHDPQLPTQWVHLNGLPSFFIAAMKLDAL